ncbi:aquaporin AQPAe.a-like [Pararge aegeria]|uniref:Jg22137 protein n=1 Tax=Pararge aegeria aegeria TaxID=348720 RepID=A0A8S4RR04_9NEOP|nr:aquaporin AQPAe.a-like [Pararge aegeria]CAH2239854.1 jg4544 [Pararge aegeria aegeria]CAH2240163.1 jg22137 [Pararge aegeria aegeria]
MSILGQEEIKDYKTILKQLFAEFLGTFLYISICLLAGTNIEPNVVAVALANGLLIASVVQIIGQISGGHINPAVTVGVFACGRIKLMKAFLYIIAQILGSLIGSTVAYAITDSDSRHELGATVPRKELRADQVFGLEFIMTFVLVAVVLSVLDTKRSDRGLGSAPLAIGLSVTACQVSAFLYTGSLNPVRSLGPAVVMNIWTKHWVYWIGPILGGLTAGLNYRFIFGKHFYNGENDFTEGE